MLQAFVITLREGIEAFLIVALSLAYLRRTGRPELAKAVYVGIAAAVLVSAAGGYLLYNASNSEWLEGPLALIAAVSVTWMIVHMWRAGRRMKQEIENRLHQSTTSTGAAAFLGVFLFTVLMVAREGMETVFLLMQIRYALHLTTGAILGIAGAAMLAWVWSRVSHRINLTVFFQVTAIFLLVFVVQLVVYAVHEMSEQNYLPFSEFLHVWTESWGPDSAVGHALVYAMVVLPTAWLVVTLALRRGSAPSQRRMEEAVR